MTAQRPLADQLALPILLLGAVLISFSGIFVKLSEVGPISTGFFRMALPATQIGGGFAALAGIFVACPKLPIPTPAQPKGAPPPKPVAPST